MAKQQDQNTTNKGKMTSWRAAMISILCFFFDSAQLGIVFMSAGISAIGAVIPVVGWLAGVIASGVGFVVSWFISLVSIFIILLLLLMWGFSFWKSDKGRTVMIVFAMAALTEAVPLANNLPAWSGFAVFCLKQAFWEKLTGKSGGTSTKLLGIIKPA